VDIAAAVPEKVGVVLGVASGTVDESELAQWLRDHARAV
jgi:prophage maintenance system killer protein